LCRIVRLSQSQEKLNNVWLVRLLFCLAICQYQHRIMTTLSNYYLGFLLSASVMIFCFHERSQNYWRCPNDIGVISWVSSSYVKIWQSCNVQASVVVARECFKFLKFGWIFWRYVNCPKIAKQIELVLERSCVWLGARDYIILKSPK